MKPLSLVAVLLLFAVGIDAQRPGDVNDRPDLARPIPQQGANPPTRRQEGLPPLPTNKEPAKISYESLSSEGSVVHGRGVKIDIGEYHLEADRLEGDWDKELVLTGNPTLSVRGQTITGDGIYFRPRSKGYRVVNLHTVLSPDFIKSQLTVPLLLSGEEVSGTRNGNLFGSKLIATTCDNPDPHYYMLAQDVEVEPGKKATLRKVAFYLWGHKLLTLSKFVIPLDKAPKRFSASHMPVVGQSVDEGYFAKQTFNTYIAEHVPGLVHVDLMQKKGLGLGTEQAYNFAKFAGAFAIYAIPTNGFTKDISIKQNHRENIGGGQEITFANSLQQNSYLAVPATTNISNQFTYGRNWEGLNTQFTLNRSTTSSAGTATGSGGYNTSNLSSSLGQGIQLSKTSTLQLNADYSHLQNNSPGSGNLAAITQTNDSLTTKFQFDDREKNYTFQAAANKKVPIGQQSQQSFFNGVEKLPELSLNNYRFTSGPLSRAPVTFLVSAGNYSEGSTNFGSSSGTSTVQTERLVAGFDVNNSHYTLTPSTDLNVSGGFQQYLYGVGGIAQYVVKNNTTLSEHFGHKSGININYAYQQSEGGSPFRFDQQSRFHALNADAGLLDNKAFQLSARVGYDLSHNQFGGVQAPWQTLSTNMMIRPVDWFRFKNLNTFDPNTGKFITSTFDLRFRGGNQFSTDIVAKYDPQRHTFGQLNSYFNWPILKEWRILGLFQYNGYMSRFESTNLQIIKDLHCMEASFTYINNPFGYTNDKQILFSLRIKGLPTFQRFGVGQFGQAIDTSIGD